MEGIRKSMSMKFIFSDCRSQLRGRHNYDLLPDENWAFWQLYNLAGMGERAGYIEKAISIPYTHNDLAYETNCPIELVERTLSKSIKHNMLAELDGGIYVIVRWSDWQVVELGSDKPVRRKPQTQSSPTQQANQELSNSIVRGALGGAATGRKGGGSDFTIDKSKKKGGK